MSTINLKQRQIMLSFAYLAYCGELITSPNPEPTILGYINAAMPQIPPLGPKGSWEVVWGPVTYTVPGALYQENMMFVAKKANTDQFVIAIRGTNGIADIDWLMEDFDILDMMNWPPGTPQSQTGPRISEGTSIGLHLLLLMQSKLVPGTEPALLDFLKSQTARQKIQLCVTGHSLGGCLAGTMALYLKENPGLWDSSGTSDVSCITFAAPTAGNGEFAQRSDAAFNGKSAWPGWDPSLETSCDRVHCSLDVAPMAWIANNLQAPGGAGDESPLFNIYEPQLYPSMDILGIEGFAVWEGLLNYVFPPIVTKMEAYGYRQIESGAAPLTGKFDDRYKPPSDDIGFEEFLTLFADEAVYQHAESYPVLLGVPELNNANIIRLKPEPLAD